MPQLILTEKDFVNDKTLQILLPSKLYLSSCDFKVGVCWIYVTFKQRRGARKILIGSDSVESYQSIQNTQLIGSFNNTNNERHFFSEANYPQFLAKVNKGSCFRIQLFNQDNGSIYLQDIKHFAVCIVLRKITKMKEKNILLALNGEVNFCGSDENTMSYICNTNIPQGIRINEKSTVAITDIFLPRLTCTEGNVIRNVIGDHKSGVLHISIYSNIVSYDSDINSQLLRSFCIKFGEQTYTPPFLLYTLCSAGEYRALTFTIKVHSCTDLMKYYFKGNIEISLSIKN